jgi:ferric-dicitrate binding protein FerR (iron transport regulator)
MEFIKNIFRKYQDGQAASPETEMLDTWYAASGEQDTPDWIDAEHLAQVKADMLKHVSAQLNFPVTDLQPLYTVRKLPVRRWLPYAAAVVLAVTGWMLAHRLTPRTKGRELAKRQVFFTGPTIRKKLVLPDSTTIWLNNGSRLSLSINDYRNAATREVWLEEGEAYFEVAKNAARPFIVHVDSLEAKVLGTAFNIEAYRQLASTQVLVSHGRVQVSAAGLILDTLLRNKQLTFYSKDRFFVIQKTAKGDGPAWWDNRFVLDDASFKELALRLQLKFGVQLTSNNQRILQTSFSAVFPENVPLENVLAVLCTIYKTSYHRVANRVTIQ